MQDTAFNKSGQASRRSPPFRHRGRSEHEGMSMDFKAPYSMLPSEAVREAKQGALYLYT